MEKPFPRPITETIGEESFVHCSAHVRTCFKTMSAAEAAAAPSTHGAGVSDMVLLRKLSEKSVAKNLEDLLPGDERVRDEITSQLKYQTKLFKAQQFLDEKKEEIQERGDAGKEALEAEAKSTERKWKKIIFLNIFMCCH